MPTVNQVLEGVRLRKQVKKRSKALQCCPQKKGVCVKVFLMDPKKPNSANRKVARMKLSNNKFITCLIPGTGHNLQKFSTVLIRGGKARDLPGVKYKAVRGVLDLAGVKNRKRSRSLYGTPII